MENDKVMFNWKDLFVKVLFLVGFFLILLWLYPNNNLKTFYDKVFNENIQTMKNAARNYYTEDRLPSKKDESIKMNLETMIDEKIILPFSDKDNNSCNETKSYVEVTKINDDEYSLKVSLTCGKQTDYILDTISLDGCVECGNKDNQSSEDNNSGNNDNDDDKNYCTTKEYEYKKVTKEEKYSCPAGFVKSGPYCSRTDLADKVAAHLVNVEDKKIVTAASINTGDSYKVYATPVEEISYVCSNAYDNAGTYKIPTVCIKKTTETAPSEKKVTYTCSSEYTNAGTYTTYTKCYANAQTSTPAPAKTTYTCSSAYDNAGTYNVNTTCYKDNHITAEASKITKTTYICGSQYTNAGTYNVPTTCLKNKTVYDPATTNTIKTYTCSSEYTNAGTYTVPTICLKNKTVYDPAPANTSTTYTCGSEYSNAGTYTYPVTCTKSAASTSTTTAGYYTAWSCGSCTTTRYTAPKSNTTTKKYEATGTGYGYSCSTISQCPNMVYYYYYIVYSRSYVNPVTTYTCSSAYDNAGTYSYNVTCTKSVAATSNSKTTYTCSSAYINAGTYNVPTQCAKTVSDNAQAPEKITYSYTCSSEYTNAGTYTVPTQCSKVVSDNAPAEEKTSYTYKCSSEYTNAGTYNVPTTCYKDVRTTANPTVKTTYTCSSAYTNAGTYNVPTMCVASATIAKEPKINNQYVCDNSYDNAGTYSTQITCSREKSLSTPATKSSNKHCPNPYIQSGSGETITCYKNMKNDDKYYCKDSSAQLIGTTCVKYVKGSSVKKCDAGYILSNGQCYKYDNKFIKAELTDCNEKIEYIWSPTETLEGWERTGNTRNSEVKCPEVKSCLDEKSNECPVEDEAK